MARIETGVDRLVELINQDKRISIEDAAKKLGISKVVIQEWADFLEEEKIISIEYKFSKTFLVQRRLTHEEVKEKEKEYSTEKDAFVRKVESSLKNLENDSLGLEKMKAEFDMLKKSIGEEMGSVKHEVAQLEKFEYLKKNLDKDIEKQVAEFQEILDKAHKEIDSESKKHQTLIEQIEIEKREVQLKEKRLQSLEEKEKELMARIQNIIDVSKELGRRVSEERGQVAVSENRIMELEKAVKEIEGGVRNKKDSIQPLLDKAKKHEEQILKVQQDILEKTRQKTEYIRSKVVEGSKVMTNFEKFFGRKTEIEALISEIDAEKKDLENQFRMLEKKALAFNLATKSDSVNSHIRELESDLEGISRKKSKFKEDLERLIKLIKG
jgi:chromosome segregation ATPase